MYDYPTQCPTPDSSASSRSPSPDFARTLPGQLPSPSTLSSLSLDVVDSDDDDILPNAPKDHEPSGLLELPDLQWKTKIPAADDLSIDPEPSRHVDYLSHEWKEEDDICASWRYITARKNAYSNGIRLENAAWRTWAKFKLNLSAVSPESLNW